jgi:DNA polymerase III subunit epsilon
MNLLIYDFETTGIPEFSKPSEDPCQPHIVQLGAVLVDTDKDKIIHGIDLIIRPDGWVIAPDISEIHGITTEYAAAVGVPEELAIRLLMEMWDVCGSRLAHNESFDARIARIAIKRFLKDDTLADAWKDGEAECTARMSVNIVNLPPTAKMVKANFNKPKTPKLTEAYEFFMGKSLANAHSAMADCLGCYEVYKAIKAGQTTRLA